MTTLEQLLKKKLGNPWGHLHPHERKERAERARRLHEQRELYEEYQKAVLAGRPK